MIHRIIINAHKSVSFKIKPMVQFLHFGLSAASRDPLVVQVTQLGNLSRNVHLNETKRAVGRYAYVLIGRLTTASRGALHVIGRVARAARRLAGIAVAVSVGRLWLIASRSVVARVADTSASPLLLLVTRLRPVAPTVVSVAAVRVRRVFCDLYIVIAKVLKKTSSERCTTYTIKVKALSCG